MRRNPSRIAPVLLVGLLALATRADWPQFQGPAGNSHSTEAGLLRAFPAGGPKVLWTVEMGPGYGSAAIRDGQVFVLDRIGTEKDALRCLDLANGKELWRYAYDAPGTVNHEGSRSVPSVDERYIFTVGCFGHLHCFERQTRKPLWNKHLLDDFGGKLPRWAVAQSPLLYKDTVIVGPLTPKAGLVAYDKATGKLAWQTKSLGAMQYVSPMLAGIGGVDQVVQVTADGVFGVEAASGRILWSYTGWTCRIAIPTPTAIGDGRLFITGGYGAGSAMIRVEKDGEAFKATELYKLTQGTQIPQALLITDHLYVLANTNDERDGLVCLGLDGKMAWQTHKSPNLDRGSLIVADGVIWSMDGVTGELRIIEPSAQGYKELARAKLLSGRSIWAPLALSGGRLVMRDATQMKCVDVRRGE